MDVVVAEDAAAGPQERVEQADLVHQLGDAVGLRRRGAAARAHAVGAHRDDVADLPVADAVEQFLPRAAVPDHQADADLQVLLHGRFAELEHAAGGGAVHRDRLLHEDVQALLDGVAELHPAERGRRGEDGDVAGLEAVDRLAVPSKPMNWRSCGTSIWTANCCRRRPWLSASFGREDVGHGDQLDGAVLDAERVFRGAGAAAAAADQRELDGVVLRRMDMRKGHAGQGGHPGDAAAIGQELAS